MLGSIFGTRRFALEEMDRSDIFLLVFLASIIGCYDWEHTPEQIANRAFETSVMAVEALCNRLGIPEANR